MFTDDLICADAELFKKHFEEAKTQNGGTESTEDAAEGDADAKAAEPAAEEKKDAPATEEKKDDTKEEEKKD